MDESLDDETRSDRLHLLIYAVEDALDTAAAAFKELSQFVLSESD
jgi:hypothetical protein